MTIFIVLLTLISAGIALYSYFAENKQLYYIFKPVTTLLIILLVMLNQQPITPFYKITILGGLIFSLAGDILLMLPRERFLLGLISFLIAHIFYITAFSRGVSLPLHWWPVSSILVFSIILLRMILPFAGSYRIPVVIYTSVIGAMAWIATERMLTLETIETFFAALGAVLFLASDALLGVRKFIREFPAAQMWILSTYYTAQILIALSV